MSSLTVRDDVDLLAAERPDMAELTAAQVAPIEERTRDWPDSWRDIARSLYISLIFRPEPLQAGEAAQLAAELMVGIAADMGGSQPYINQGAALQRGGLAERVVALLRAHRQDYDRVAQIVGMTARHVRRIERRYLLAERQRQQYSLQFEQDCRHPKND